MSPYGLGVTLFTFAVDGQILKHTYIAVFNKTIRVTGVRAANLLVSAVLAIPDDTLQHTVAMTTHLNVRTYNNNVIIISLHCKPECYKVERCSWYRVSDVSKIHEYNDFSKVSMRTI